MPVSAQSIRVQRADFGKLDDGRVDLQSVLVSDPPHIQSRSNSIADGLVYIPIDMLEAKEDNGEPFNPQLWLESTISEIPKSMPELPEWDDHTHGPSNPQPDYPNVQPYPSVENNETSPLLNKNKAKAVSKGVFRAAVVLARKATSFMNPPMWGGVLAIISGLIPWLRHSLFDDSGVLSAFEQSVENLGDLYTSLQTLILGSQLYSKAGHRPPVGAVAYLFLYRFFIVTGVSCGLVVASRKLLGDYIKKDPILVSRPFVRRDPVLVLIALFPLSAGLYVDPCTNWTICALAGRHRLHVGCERRDGLGRRTDLACQPYRHPSYQSHGIGSARGCASSASLIFTRSRSHRSVSFARTPRSYPIPLIPSPRSLNRMHVQYGITVSKHHRSLVLRHLQHRIHEASRPGVKEAFIQIQMTSACRSPYSVRNPATVKRAANTTREIAEIWSKS
jgi:hypothetical protein